MGTKLLFNKQANVSNNLSELGNQNKLTFIQQLFQRNEDQAPVATKQNLASQEFKQTLHNNNVLELLDSIEDYRVNRTKLYSVSEIILSTIMAIMIGARSWYEIASKAEQLLDILRTYYPFKNGIPSHDTYNRFFCHNQA